MGDIEANKSRPRWWYPPSAIAERAFDIAQAMMKESKRRGQVYADADQRERERALLAEARESAYR